MNDRAGSEIVLAELVEPVVAWTGREPYGVPRRFGIGTILIVTAAYAILLALLRLAGWPPEFIICALAFISMVGLGQMFWFGSKRPRQASIVTGAIILPVIVLVWAASANHSEPMGSVSGALCAVPFGAAAGYLAGGVVAGVFLIMDAVEQALARAFPRATDISSVGPEGTELSPFSPEKTADHPTRAAVPADPALAEINEAWPWLPKTVRRALRDAVRGSTRRRLRKAR